jgi:hypothetical protein
VYTTVLPALGDGLAGLSLYAGNEDDPLMTNKVIDLRDVDVIQMDSL